MLGNLQDSLLHGFIVSGADRAKVRGVVNIQKYDVNFGNMRKAAIWISDLAWWKI